MAAINSEAEIGLWAELLPKFKDHTVTPIMFLYQIHFFCLDHRQGKIRKRMMISAMVVLRRKGKNDYVNSGGVLRCRWMSVGREDAK